MQQGFRDWIRSHSWGKTIADAIAGAIAGPVLAYVGGMIGSALLAWWATPSNFSRLDTVFVFFSIALASGLLWVCVAVGWRWLYPAPTWPAAAAQQVKSRVDQRDEIEFCGPAQRAKSKFDSFWHVPIKVTGNRAYAGCKAYLDLYVGKECVDRVRLCWGDLTFEVPRDFEDMSPGRVSLVPVAWRTEEGNDRKGYFADARLVRDRKDRMYPIRNNRGKYRFRLRVTNGEATFESQHYLVRCPDIVSNGHFVVEEEYEGEGSRDIGQSTQQAISQSDRDFRLDLQRFILSHIRDARDGLASVFGQMLQWDRQENGQSLSPEVLSRTHFIHFATSADDMGFAKISAEVEGRDVEDIDPETTLAAIREFFERYAIWRKQVHQSRAWLPKVDLLKTDVVKQWLAADRRCLDALRALRASPRAKTLNVSDNLLASSSNGDPFVI